MEINLRSDGAELVSYDRGGYRAYVRRALLSSYPGYSAVGHWHDDIEFILVLSGEMEYLVNGRQTALRAGEGLIVNARRMHYGFSPQKRECDFVCLLLHPDLLGGGYIREKFVLPLTDDRAFDFCLLAGEAWHEEILACIRAVYESAASPVAELKTSEYFLRMWSAMYLHLKGAETEGDANLAVLRSMLDCVHRRFGGALTLGEIARAGGVCKSRCNEIFHRYVHRTPVSYLIEYRLAKSVELLLGTERSVTEIALDTGFSSASNYCEYFRRAYCMTPRQYRSRHRR